MTQVGEKVDFFSIWDDKVIYDERKKRFVHTKDMPGILGRQYTAGAFKNVSS